MFQAASMDPMTPKAQQLPHCPWFLTGFMMDLQSAESGAEVFFKWVFLMFPLPLDEDRNKIQQIKDFDVILPEFLRTKVQF